MTQLSDEVVERVARAIAGFFGPYFDDLPTDNIVRRQYMRDGGNPSDNTQEDCLDAARAAIAAYEAKGDIPVDEG